MVLLGVNVAIFVVDLLSGNHLLLRGGAMVPVLIAHGEWWRLVTAMFLHIGLLHLALNMLALYIFGSLIEQTFGTARFLAIYFVTGFCASAVSFAFGDPQVPAAGASGAIFGLLGAWLAYNLRRRSLSLARANVQSALVLIAINLVFGFAVPGIDVLAHLGGLGAGFLAGFAAEGAGRRAVRRATQALGLAALLLVGVALAAWRVVALG
jgi:rhomboid protease GluP